MKKTSSIILTLVTSLSISHSRAQALVHENLTALDTTEVDTLARHPGSTGYCEEVDTLARHAGSTGYCSTPAICYSYYYRLRFFDNMFRICMPRRYYACINQPGYVPRSPFYHNTGIFSHHHIRQNTTPNPTYRNNTVHTTTMPRIHENAVRPSTTSSKRGGFGGSGSRSVTS
jgi:hypothetical protein